MIRPVLHGIEVAGRDLRGWAPEDPDVVDVPLLVSVGARRGRGVETELFTLRVATPAGLEARDDVRGVLAFQRILAVPRFDVDVVRAAVERRVTACEALEWPLCVERLAKYFDRAERR
jgi:hypothetical protein